VKKKAAATKKSTEKKTVPSKGKVLTKETAEQFLKKTAKVWKLIIRRQLDDIEPSAASALARYKGFLSLPGLVNVSDRAVARLAKHKGYGLALDGLRTLSDTAAEMLSGYSGENGLNLGGIESLSDVAAEFLGRFHGYLDLGGLTDLSESAARDLAKCGGVLHLDSLARLSSEVAEALATHKGELSLGGVKELSTLSAAALAAFEGPRLGLGGLSAVTDDVADALSPIGRRIDLPSLTEISDEAAIALAEVESVIALKNSLWDEMQLTTTTVHAATETFTANVARHFIRGHRLRVGAVLAKCAWGGPMLVRLQSFRNVDEEGARMLSHVDDALILDGVASLSEKVAMALASHRGILSLAGLTELSDLAAEALVKHQGELRVELKNLSESAAAVLTHHPSLQATTEETISETVLTRSVAQQLVREQDAKWGADVNIPGFSSMKEDAAEYLGHRGGGRGNTLFLPDLTALPENIARCLASFGGALSFRSLATVSDAAAWALAERHGAAVDKQYLRVSFSSLSELTDSPGHVKLAARLVKHIDFGTSIFLDSLTALAPKAAGALSKCKGKLILNGLQEITTETAKRLLNSMWLRLGGFTDVPDELSNAFSDKCKGMLVELPRLTTLSDQVALRLAVYQGGVELKGLESLSDTAAESLSKHGELTVKLDNLPSSAAKILRDAGHG
jgi:hypothetical protein